MSMKTSQTAQPADRIHALDGLRAMAASLIFVFHLALATWSEQLIRRGHDTFGHLVGWGGASGVDLFFVLSGVVLLRPYFRTGRAMTYLRYLQRRIQRLYPPFWGAWMLAGLTVWLVSNFPNWWDSALPKFDWVTWLSQIGLLYTGHQSYNWAWWTLNIEVIFYLLAPCFVLLLRGRGSLFWILALVATFGLAQFVYSTPRPAGPAELAWQLLVYMPCFMAGLRLAAADLSRGMSSVAVIAGALLFTLSLFRSSINPHLGLALLYMALTACAMRPLGKLARLLTHRWLVWWGERSYSFFLTHYSVISLSCWGAAELVENRSLGYFVLSRLLATVGAVLVACLLFHTVECRYAHGLVTARYRWPPRRLDFTPST